MRTSWVLLAPIFTAVSLWVQVASTDPLAVLRHQASMDDAEKYPSQLAERFQVRLPDGMRDRLREAAEVNNRSMNAEIVARLEHSLSRYVSVDDDLSVVPKRDSTLLRFMGRAEKMYNDLCEKIEEGNKRIEEENDRLRQELEDIKARNNIKPKTDNT